MDEDVGDVGTSIQSSSETVLVGMIGMGMVASLGLMSLIGNSGIFPTSIATNVTFSPQLATEIMTIRITLRNGSGETSFFPPIYASHYSISFSELEMKRKLFIEARKSVVSSAKTL